MNKKFSYHIGINDYPGTGADLYGCVNDAWDLLNAFDAEGYMSDIVLDKLATKKNIMEGIGNILSIAGWRDTVVVTYSGHGSKVPDYNGDEIDHFDEVLCAYDYNNGGLITDDELHQLFGKKRFGTRIIFIADSCNSGTVNRLVAPINFGQEEAQKARARYLPPSMILNREFDGPELLPVVEAMHEPRAITRGLKAALLSAAKDTEYAWDATFQGRPNGAFTYYLLQEMARSGMPDLKTLHRRVQQRLLDSSYDQTPQLNASWHQKFWKTF